MTESHLSRRLFVTSVGAAGSALALGFGVSGSARASIEEVEDAELAAWIVIEPDDTVVIRIARSEMGQGVSTSLPMLVAEELGCDWARVRPEYVAPHENLRRNRLWGSMTTAASRSVSGSQEYLRRAGAIAREMLIAAAAARWGAPAGECRAADSVITHLPTGRRVGFGAVAAAAARVPPPEDVVLKDPAAWRLIGSRKHRLGLAPMVTGQATYGIDVVIPGLMHAAIRHCPTFGGGIDTVDAHQIAGRAGRPRVVLLPGAIAVVAETWWQAKSALDALPMTWRQEGVLSDDEIAADLRAGLDAPDAETEIGREDGDVTRALASAARRIEAVYSVPFLAHATMEPQNCTAHVTPDRVEIWAPTQDGEASLAAAAAAAGVPQSCVVVHKTMLGGGFGRRGVGQDFVHQAVSISKAIGQPVKLLWSREEDIRHDLYRPAAMAKHVAALDAEGMPAAWNIRISAPSILNSLMPDVLTGGLDRQAFQGLLEEMSYAVPNYRVDYSMRETTAPLGMWRSVNHSQNAFFKESFVDEMAHAADQDPYLFRRKLLANDHRLLAVLDAAAQRAGWNARPPGGAARGIAAHIASGAYCAQVMELSVEAEGRLRVHRVVTAVDCGYAVDPRGIEAQIESAVAYGLSAAMLGEITIRDGGVEQSNFHDYQVMRMADMPKVETIIIASGGFWGGIGEPPLTTLAPALCNAIFAATGERIRSLPVKNHGLRLT